MSWGTFPFTVTQYFQKSVIGSGSEVVGAGAGGGEAVECGLRRGFLRRHCNRFGFGVSLRSSSSRRQSRKSNMQQEQRDHHVLHCFLLSSLGELPVSKHSSRQTALKRVCPGSRQESS